MERQLKYIGEQGYEERRCLYAYDTHPSSKLIVPTEGCLEVTLTPNKRFRYDLQYVNITLTSGILTLENAARSENECTQLFGFFGKNDVLKFGIRFKTEEEVANTDLLLFSRLYRRKEGNCAGELWIVYGGVINEEDTWEMLSSHYKDRLLERRADWTLRPGFNRLVVQFENEKDEKVKKLEAIYNQKCDAGKKIFEASFRNIGNKENKPGALETSSSKKEMKEDEKEKSKKVFEKKDWRAENHGLKVVKLTKPASEEPKKDENKPEKSAKSEESISKISKKSEKSKKSESHKSVPKEAVAETLVSQSPAPKSNRSERAKTPGKSQKSSSSVKSSSKETVTKTEITQNTELKSSAEPEKVQTQEKKKKKNPCCSIL